MYQNDKDVQGMVVTHHIGEDIKSFEDIAMFYGRGHGI